VQEVLDYGGGRLGHSSGDVAGLSRVRATHMRDCEQAAARLAAVWLAAVWLAAAWLAVWQGAQQRHGAFPACNFQHEYCV